MEFERNVREHFKFYNKVPVDSTFKFPFDINSNNDFTELFDGKVERWPMGPRAISLDFELPYDALFAGIPERTQTHETISLPDTLKWSTNGESIVVSDPYRMFNLDVFEYQANNTYLGLYGTIPLLQSFSTKKSVGNVGIYWVNAADSWLDLYSGMEQKNVDDGFILEPRRGSIWSSETNVLEFVLILAAHPKELLGKWQTVTGAAPLPPYFSLGFHQSRWSYYSADDVANVNFRFDFYEMPFDVIWLDIDVSTYDTILSLVHT
jgi:mannosyl-oligosaccharide alpha-1,3-glucosidase